MNQKILFSLLVFSLSHSLIMADIKVKSFKLKIPETKVENSLYDSIEVLDDRIDTSNVGFIKTGILNQFTLLLAPDLEKQVQNIVSHVAQNREHEERSKGTLLLHLRKFCISEETKAVKETGFFELRADLYTKQRNGNYIHLSKIDTCIQISRMDVSAGTVKRSNELFTNFIVSSLTLAPVDNVHYSMNELLYINNEEKQDIKLYHCDHYKEGVYFTFQSFAKQEPDYSYVDIKMKGETTRRILMKNNLQDRWKRAEPQEVYGIVHNGKAYISSQRTIYPLEMDENNNLYFEGVPNRIDHSANAALLGMSASFGLIGVATAGLIMEASNDNGVKDPIFKVVIDHKDGSQMVMYGDIKEVATEVIEEELYLD